MLPLFFLPGRYLTGIVLIENARRPSLQRLSQTRAKRLSRTTVSWSRLSRSLYCPIKSTIRGPVASIGRSMPRKTWKTATRRRIRKRHNFTTIRQQSCFGWLRMHERQRISRRCLPSACVRWKRTVFGLTTSHRLPSTIGWARSQSGYVQEQKCTVSD